MENNQQFEAATCSHQDVSRQGVGKTAHVVAMLRAIETSRQETKRLICDPFAKQLAGETGNKYIRSYASIFYFLIGSDLLRTILYLFSPLLSGMPSLGMLDGIAIRSRRIDDEISFHIKNHHVQQICVLGAGLDARPWRLKYSDWLTDHNKDDSKHKYVKYFELDFKEIFDFKLPVIEENGGKSDFDYVPVRSDLSLPSWPNELLFAGFDTSKPTLWIMEGFTGYLKEEELRRVFDIISNQLSAKSSRLMATFVRPEALRLTLTKGLHQNFRAPNPAQFVASYGWINVTEESFDEAGSNRYKRHVYPVGSIRGHVFVTGEKE